MADRVEDCRFVVKVEIRVALLKDGLAGAKDGSRGQIELLKEVLQLPAAQRRLEVMDDLEVCFVPFEELERSAALAAGWIMVDRGHAFTF